MKKICRLLSLVAVAALCFSACTEELNNDKINGGKTVTVHFGTENTDPSTKATLTPDEGETAFQANWENEDEISVKYSNDNGEDGVTGTTTAIWNGKSFESKMPEYTGMWIYDAAYPVPASDNSVDFGPNRTQKGNAYNSKYDIMIGSAVAENAAAGKDEAGKDIVFKMTRQTAIAYFHFTSKLNEAVTSATLTVSGEDAAIASNSAYVSDFAWAPTKDCQSITITFPEEAPNAQDFLLWFNVLPTNYTKMTLIVETATKTFTISKNTTGEYIAGKLYKVKKGIAWTDKGGSSTPATNVSVINVDNVNAVKEMGNGSYEDYKDKVQTITVDGLEYSMINICANSKNGNTGYMMAAKQFIQMKSASSYILNTKSGVTNIKAWVLPKTTDAISVYQGSTSNNISTLINNPNKTTETVKLISNLDKEVDTQLDIYEYTITDGFFKLAPSATLWLYKLEVTYSNSGSSEPAPDTYSVSCASVTGGTLSASPLKAVAGAEVTLTATPDAGYEFNNDWTVKDADGAKIDVYDGKFTMPAKDVTVSGSFSKADYTITKATCEGGSFTVTKNGVEVTKAQIDETITLTASAAEGYEFDSWSVTNETTSKSVYVNENTFTMPGANVTVKANFVELAVVPEYASLEELVKAGTPTTDGTYVTVTLTNDEITGIYTTSKGYRNGIYFKVGTQEVEIYCQNVPESWVIGGYVSVTLTNCAWKLYSSTWELCPSDWTELTYSAPCEKPVITLDGDKATITCATEGATIRYTLDGSNPVETSDEYTSAITLTEGQTIKAKAFLMGHKPSEVASKTYSSTGGEASWTRVTTVNELIAGGTFIIGYEANAKSGIIVPMANTGSATTSAAGFIYSGSKAVSGGKDTIDMSTVSETSNYEVTIVASTYVSGAICIKLGDNYLGNTNTKNNCKLFTTEAATTAFTPTVGSNDVFTLKIAANKDYHTLQYNASSPRFAVYGGAQKNVVIYKKGN